MADSNVSYKGDLDHLMATKPSRKPLSYPSNSSPISPTKLFFFFFSLLFALILLWARLSTTPLPNSLLPSSSSISNSPSTRPPWNGDLRLANFAWNKLCLGRPPEKLRLAVFSRKWPMGSAPGGMERHAYTLYTSLAKSGHNVHVFTVPSKPSSSLASHGSSSIIDGNLHIHFSPNNIGNLNITKALELMSHEDHLSPFDVLHTESVAIPHYRAWRIDNLAVTWHGIAYEALHSDIFQDLLLTNTRDRSTQSESKLHELIPKLLEEIRFFGSYKHHIGISDSVSEILTDIYQLPKENVHTILNGVDHHNFFHDPELGSKYRKECGVPVNASLVMGVAGRLVKDKGHPLLFEAFSRVRLSHPTVYLLIAGAGPWEARYRDLEPNVIVLGALEPSRLAEFYNALDVFVNPTLRPQGLDLTLMEAMHCGKPLLASNFPSIKRSVVVDEEFGYVFAPNAKALERALEAAINDGREVLKKKGMACKEYARAMFTAEKMAKAYERFFLCMKNEVYCNYPLSFDCEN